MIENNFTISNNQKIEELIDLTNSFVFKNWEVKYAKSADFYYFYNESKRCYGNTFILTNQPQVQKRCEVNFMKGEDEKLLPKFKFLIWDKIKNKRINEIDYQDNENNFKLSIKAQVELSGDGSVNFWKLVGFLFSVKKIDLDGFGNYQIIDSNAFVAFFKTKKELEKIEELKKIFSDPNLNESLIQIALKDSRKKTVDEFKKLLEDDTYIDTYRNAKQIKKQGDESVWHHFLRKNDWLLGLNVDVRFIGDFTNEVHVGVQDTSGSGSPKSDLMGVSDYTMLIELKTANTNFFSNIKKGTSRANTWSFSSDLIDGFSQCLGQKFDWDKFHKVKDLKGDNGVILDQDMHRTVDPKVIFIIGNKQKELSIKSKEGDIIKKRETLERFRRNNRNVEIISFDELYERAYFIVNNEQAPELIVGDNI